MYCLVVVMEPDAASYPYGKTLKITDFDHIRELDDTRTMTQFGTYAWMAFEVIDKSKFSKKSDVYRSVKFSLRCSVYS